MSSKHDPILLLEPSNLLEPLSLEDRNLDPFNRAARFGGDGTSLSEVSRERGHPIPVPRERRGRLPLKSALIVAGGLACFGAGAAMPGLSMFGGAQRAQTVESATRLPPADAAVKPEAAKPAEPKVTESTPPAPGQTAAPNANANDANTSAANNAPSSSAPAPDRPTVDRSAAAATDAVGGGASPGTNATPADQRRADPRATDPGVDARPQDMERAQPSPRNRRAAQRDTAEQPLAEDENMPAANLGDSRPNRDSNRGSSRRRDRAVDNTRATNDWSPWRDQETDRPSSRRRDRYDDDARDDERRSSRRSSRYGGRSLFPFFDEW